MPVILDRIDTLNMVEQEGVVVALTREAFVYGLDNTYEDSYTLQEALNQAGVPQLGHSPTGNANLKVWSREVRMEPGCTTKASVIIQYKTVADYANSFIFSGGSSIQQKQTDVDRLGNRISLSYTYPGDYEPNPDLAGTTFSTAINESVTVPHLTMTATGSLYVDYPNQIALEWINTVNSTYWAGAPPYYWLCTACNFRGRDIGFGRAHLWEFDWTFEYNPDSWYVVAKIRDPQTGNIPDDVIDGVGVKTVDWYRYKNFNSIFGNT